MIKLTKLLIDNVDYADYAVWTLQGQDTLDESLDLNYIELKGTDLKLPFKPFLDVHIELQDNSGTHIIERFVESDTVTEVISNKSYNHDLLFIEETKWLERLFVEKTVRQPLIHDYKSTLENQQTFVEAYSKRTAPGPVEEEQSDAKYFNIIPSIMTPGVTYKLPNPLKMMYLIQENLDVNYLIGRYSSITGKRSVKLTITGTDGEYLEFYAEMGASESVPETTIDFTPNENSYQFELKMDRQVYESGGYYIEGDAVFSVSAFMQADPKPDYTVRDVINQLLETCITLRENETPIFSIAEPTEYAGASEDYKKQIETILNTVSPEFTFSKMSLFEALKTIGDFAHFIPRVQNKKVYFDLLGQMEYADTESLGEYYSNVSSQASNDFCSALDSQVNNLTNMDDVGQGSVTTPGGAGYRTLRSETGSVQIRDDNIIIPTEENIENIVSLEIGYLKDNKTIVGDITPFVYEEDEYNTLSSYTNVFPTSRMFAIKYKQGTKNITGLTWQRQNVVHQAFEGIAIKNIIYKKLNRSINAWGNLWDDEDVFNLQYRLTYIPSTNTKVTQHKQGIDDMPSKPLYIAYNQSAGKVSSNAYGENLKGTIAKLGNVVKTRMYVLPSFDLIPKCGTLFDKDYYISVVKYEVYPTFIKCEVGLSKNYNNKSAYVEINSQLEFFEYNRNITIDRYVVYEEFCNIEDTVADEDNTNTLISGIGLDIFGENFVYDESGAIPIQNVKAQGYSDRSGGLTEVVLPVISLGVGNSLLFAFHYEDTISAGVRAYKVGAGKSQYFVKYTDIYGEVDKLKLSFGIDNYSPTGYEDAVSRGDNLPLSIASENMDTYFETGDNKIVLRKGVGENPHFTYQIHFVTNNPSFVIGSGLTRKCIFTNSEPRMFKLYALPNEINKFETRIDLTNAIEIGTLELSGVNSVRKSVKLKDKTSPDGSYKAWAIVQTYNNQNDLILGKNIEFKGGDTLKMPAFIFKRRVK